MESKIMERGQMLTSFYNKSKRRYTSYVKKRYNLDEDIITDIFHDSFIVLYENINQGKVSEDTLRCSLETYLFSIAIHKLNNYFRKERYMVQIGEKEDFADYHEEEDRERQEIINQSLKELEKSCSNILHLFYYEKKSMKEIAEIMGYKSEQVAKNKRVHSVKKLKEIIERRYRKDDLL